MIRQEILFRTPEAWRAELERDLSEIRGAGEHRVYLVEQDGRALGTGYEILAAYITARRIVRLEFRCLPVALEITILDTLAFVRSAARYHNLMVVEAYPKAAAVRA